jgi:hypothetical protein
MDEGSLTIAEDQEKSTLIRLARAGPFGTYPSVRKAEFYALGCCKQRNQARADEEVRRSGLDPIGVPRYGYQGCLAYSDGPGFIGTSTFSFCAALSSQSRPRKSAEVSRDDEDNFGLYIRERPQKLRHSRQWDDPEELFGPMAGVPNLNRPFAVSVREFAGEDRPRLLAAISSGATLTFLPATFGASARTTEKV